MIIDEKGRLFGLINLLDLILLIGVVILLYLGASVYLIYRQPVLTMKGITPKQIEVGQSQLCTLSLANERVLKAARIRLIPKDFQGRTVQLEGRADPRGVTRDVVTFTVPPEVQPGQYQIELEVVTMDIFTREALYTTRRDEQLLTIKPKSPPKVEERGKYFWPMELEVFFPPEQKSATAGLRPGAEVAGLSGGFTASVLSVRGSRSTDTLSLTGKPWWDTAIPYRGGRVARMRAEVDFVDLPSFQHKVLSSGGRLDIRHGEQDLTGYLLGMVAIEPQLPDNLVRWEVNLIMLSLNDAQKQALKANAMQIDPNSGLVLAQVIQVSSRKGSPWWKVVPATEPGKIAPKSSPSNIVVRMNILCELKDGRAYFRGVPVKQEALLSFELGGQRMVGTVLTTEEPVAIRFNVLFPAVPRQVAAQIKRGMLVYDPKTMEPLGTIRQVLASKPVELPYSFKAEYRKLGREYRRCLVRMEIYCSPDKNGLVYSHGQKIDYGLPLEVVLFSERLGGIITIIDSLPPPVKLDWHEVEVVFRDLSPAVVALIREGETEVVENEPVTMVIKGIISDEPSLYLGITEERTIKVGRHPSHRDVRCRLRIMAYRKGEKLFYKGRQLYIGGEITFNSARWMAKGELIDF